MTNKSNDSVETVLSLSFQGPEPNGVGVNVVTLSRCLMAVQSLVNKAWLIQQNREPNTAKMTSEERRRLSLAIASRKESSDAYLLSTITHDPLIGPILPFAASILLAPLLKDCQEWVDCLYKYYTNRTQPDTLKEPLDSAAYQHVLAIEPEIMELAKEVNDAGLTSIFLSTGKQLYRKQLVIDFKFRKVLENHLKVSQAHGAISVQGRVTGMKIKNKKFSAELAAEDGMSATLLLGRELFQDLKNSWDRESTYRFDGRRTGKVSSKKNTYGKVKVEKYQLIGK